ncbi:MAG: CopM family metallochaperone [Janthinobacterium lividum]
MKKPYMSAGTKLCLAAALIATAAVAQAQTMAPMAGMNMGGGAPTTGDTPSTTAFKATDQKMMDGMHGAYTGNPDQDFVAKMIPHHEGAVGMAEVELKYGKDPALRKLARGIIKAQDSEIAFMKKWQAAHPGH